MRTRIISIADLVATACDTGWRRIVPTIVCLFVAMAAIAPTGATAQPLPLTLNPIWSSGSSLPTYALAFGDMDGDGDLDLVCGNGFLGNLENTYYLNEDGVLSAWPVWQTDPINNTFAIAVGDVNGNGYPDIVCGNDGPNTLYENNAGMPSISPDWVSDPTWNTAGVALADIDADGDLDLICGNSHVGLDGQANTMYRNDNGRLTSTPVWSSDSTFITRSVDVGDVDGDGDLDLVCGNWLAANTLYLNQDGDLSTAPVWQSGDTDGTYAVRLGDIDGDGDLDLVCGNLNEANTMYRNDNGLFTAMPVWSSDSTLATMGIDLGDVDGDGDLDLACGNRGDTSGNQSNTLYLNVGGVLSSSPAWLSEPVSVTIAVAFGDVDGDGDLELACGNVGYAGQINTLYDNVSPMFDVDPAWSSFPDNPTRSVALGDVDGDGDLDLVCGNNGANNTLYLTEGDSLSQTPEWSSSFASATSSVTLGDVDGDEHLDLVCGNFNESNTLYLGQDGRFSSSAVWSSIPTNPTESVALADIDGDGDLDLVCGNDGVVGPDSNTVYLNNDGVLSGTPDWSSGSNGGTLGIDAGDVNTDGVPEIVCANFDQPNTLYSNDSGTLSVWPTWSSDVAHRTRGVALGDIDGNGYLDLVCGNWTQSNTLYPNDGGTFSLLPVWSSGMINATRSVALGDIDGDGDLDLVCGNGLPAQSNTLYVNHGEVFSVTPDWSSTPTNDTESIVLGDIDSDGDLDLVCGNIGPNVLYRGTKDPVYRGDPLSPTNQLSNNAVHLRSVRVEHHGVNTYRTQFVAIDVESDRFWLLPEFQFEGDPRWFTAKTGASSDQVGPFTSSPGGVTDSFNWDVSQIPFDGRTVVLRLRAIETPGQVCRVQRVASYFHEVGPIEPVRPEIDTSTGQIVFPTVTWGDTVWLDFEIRNIGNVVLRVSDILLPSAEMHTSPLPPFDLAPGASDSLRVYLAPRRDENVSGAIAIASNDPITPVETIHVQTDIRPLDIKETRLLSPADSIPLGEAVTVIVTPERDVKVERGSLYHRHAGAVDFDLISLSPSGDEFIGIIPGKDVTEAGIEYYVEVENSGIIDTDPSEAPSVVWSQPVKQPMVITTNPVPNSGPGFLEGLDIKVQVSLPTGASFVSGKLYFRPGGETEYKEVDMQSAVPFPFAVIPDSIPSARGVEFWVQVQTLTRSITDPPREPQENPFSIRVTVESLAFPFKLPVERYRMISIPLEMEGTITGTFDELGGRDPTVWRVFGFWDKTSDDYIELPNDTLPQLEQGRGYWLITRREGIRLDTRPNDGRSAPTDSAFVVVLKPDDWTMVGNPFAFPVDWSAVLVDTFGTADATGVVIGPLKDAGGGDVTVLEPFKGFWVRNLMQEPVELHIPPKESADGSDAPTLAPTVVAVANDVEWHLVIHAFSGYTEDLHNYIGVAPGAVNTRDHRDRFEPPMSPGRALSLYFPHMDWNTLPGCYSQDVRGSYERLTVPVSSPLASDEMWGHIWRFDIAKNFADQPAGDEVCVEVAGIADLPSEAKVYLVDVRMKRMIDLATTPRYTLFLAERGIVSKDEDARFALLVGCESFVDTNAEVLRRPPAKTALYQNYPNPFNPSTIIAYDVATPTRATLMIYDVTGARVKVLEDRHHTPGRYEIHWNGTNERGERVATGVYFYRLELDEFVATRKMVLLE